MSEERIEELEKRIKKLEQKEKRRQIFATLKTIVFLIIIGVFAYFAFSIYQRVKPIISTYESAKEKYDSSSWSQVIDNFLK
ncbi:MAG: hypothetical protein IJI60_04895 [Bacilli bacterium]|nr:hypothetical protein [Bacilli bacterium]